MRKIAFVLGILALAVLIAGPALAEYVSKSMTPEEYKAFLAQHQGKAKTPPMMKTKAGSRFPGCMICTTTPRCRAGYVQVGYTELYDFVSINGWGKPSPGPGGRSEVISQTIVQGNVCVHDHVKSAICDPAKK